MVELELSASMAPQSLAGVLSVCKVGPHSASADVPEQVGERLGEVV